MQPASSHYLVTPQQTLSAARQAGLRDDQLALSGVAVLTFSKAIMDRMGELCGLEDAAWIAPLHHPYAAAEVVRRGVYREMAVTALVPSMGASPTSCVIEDLVACGVQVVFLVCPAWSLGSPVAFGDLIVPAFSLGPDGTSIHYGNDSGEVHARSEVVEALTEACRTAGARYHVGGNASCEALYRIAPEMVADFRARGCLSMENGEASTVFAMARALGIPGGVLFQPYIDLQQGWNPTRFDDVYVSTCRLQAEIVLEASLRLLEK